MCAREHDAVVSECNKYKLDSNTLIRLFRRVWAQGEKLKTSEFTVPQMCIGVF